MKNRDKLYALYAKVPGSLFNARFDGYNYTNTDTGETERRFLQDFDITLYTYMKLHSDMRNPFENKGKGYGTGMTHWYSIRMLSNSSRRKPIEVDPSNETNPPAWSTSKICRSLKRLTEAGFLAEKIATNAARKAHLRDPYQRPSKKEKTEEELIKAGWKEEEKHV